MLRIARAFANKAKIAYLTAGDGGELSAEYFLALARAGVNILEVGIPFSDPIADGTAIQLAMERALKNGTDIDRVLDIVSKIRANTEAAIVLFTYLNPIQKDLAGFLKRAKQAGIDGILVVDLPYEEGSELQFLCDKLEIALILVSAPSTPLQRMGLLSQQGGGFLYYACQKGTTGTRDKLPEDLIKRMEEIKKHTQLPVAVGFGVSNSQMVREILNIADGCVIGSYFVNAVAKNVTPQELQKLAEEVFLC